MQVLTALLGMLLVMLAPMGGSLDPPADPCHFQFGFAALHDSIPQQVGDCVDDERAGPGGDTLQHTSRGLLVWRKVDNIAAFTDGQTTWEAAPYGLMQRPNGRRFPWEANPAHLPLALLTAGDGVVPPPAPRSLLPARRIVAFYGNPRVPAMGALGQGTPQAMLARLQAQADAYAQADPGTPVQPALELITVVAEADPGPDGLYRSREAPELVEQVASWAAGRNYLLILDVQAGRSPVMDEVRALLPYLQRPNVELAIDPEFAMRPDQVPGLTYGQVDAATVNQAIATLGDLVTQHHLPPKVLIVHRFREDMLTNYRAIHLDPRVQVVIDMDGFGTPGMKLDSYNAFVRDQPVEYAGIKPFYVQDTPTLTPAQILALQPRPSVVIYQ